MRTRSPTPEKRTDEREHQHRIAATEKAIADVSLRRCRWSAPSNSPRQRTATSSTTSPAAAPNSDDKVVARRRVLLVDDDPLMLSTYYFPCELVAGTRIEGAADVPEGTTAVLRQLGYPLVSWVVDVLARLPTAAEADVLDVPRGTPLLLPTWTHSDPGGRPVRVYEQVLPADRHVLHFTGEQLPDEDLP